MAVDVGQFTAHPAVAPLVVGLALAVVAFGRRVVRTLRALDDHVLPHFTPPKPGTEDHTLPARVGRVESSVTSLDRDLRTHMADEATHVRQLHQRIDDAITRRDQ